MSKLNPNKNSAGYQPGMQINPPPVNLRMPKIVLPEIKVPDVTVNADMQPIVMAIQQLIQNQNALLGLVKQLVEREVKVDVKAPSVTVQAPKRAGSYYVELDKEDGETVGMRVVPQRGH